MGWFIAKRPSQHKQWSKDDPREKIEQQKSSIRALVEHPFCYVKQVFGYNKARYKGLKKNTDRICMLLVFANLMITEKHRPA